MHKSSSSATSNEDMEKGEELIVAMSHQIVKELHKAEVYDSYSALIFFTTGTSAAALQVVLSYEASVTSFNMKTVKSFIIAASIIAAVSGVHSGLSFELVSVYSKTALSQDTAAFKLFQEKSVTIRKRAFSALLLSCSLCILDLIALMLYLLWNEGSMALFYIAVAISIGGICLTVNDIRSLLSIASFLYAPNEDHDGCTSSSTMTPRSRGHGENGRNVSRKITRGRSKSKSR